jgi:hypothetical protein
VTENFDIYIAHGSLDECWPWIGGCDPDGYGIYWSKDLKKNFRAHRFAFYREFGWWPTFVCHHCDNPPCCNPACLFAGDAQTNHDDMALKGRRAKMSSYQKHTKLNDDRVRKIREDHAAGRGSYRILALEHNVSTGLIQQVVQRRIWKHVV